MVCQEDYEATNSSYEWEYDSKGGEEENRRFGWTFLSLLTAKSFWRLWDMLMCLICLDWAKEKKKSVRDGLVGEEGVIKDAARREKEKEKEKVRREKIGREAKNKKLLQKLKDDKSYIKKLKKGSKRYIEDAKGKDMVVFLGLTEAGKTSLIYYLLGKKFRKKVLRNKQFAYVPEDEELWEKINTRGVSKTSETEPLGSLNNTLLVDFPGFGDVRNPMAEVGNLKNMVSMIEAANSVKFCLLIPYKKCFDAGGEDLNKELRRLDRHFLGELCGKYSKSVYLVVSKCNGGMYEEGWKLENVKVEFEDRLLHNKNYSSKQYVFLKDRILLFHPKPDENSHSQNYATPEDFAKEFGRLDAVPVEAGMFGMVLDEETKKKTVYDELNSFLVEEALQHKDSYSYVQPLLEQAELIFEGLIDPPKKNLLESAKKETTKTRTLYQSLLLSCEKKLEEKIEEVENAKFDNKDRLKIIEDYVDIRDNRIKGVLDYERLDKFARKEVGIYVKREYLGCAKLVPYIVGMGSSYGIQTFINRALVVLEKNQPETQFQKFQLFVGKMIKKASECKNVNCQLRANVRFLPALVVGIVGFSLTCCVLIDFLDVQTSYDHCIDLIDGKKIPYYRWASPM